jgi:anti-anti-sigma regulatory factor
VTYDVTLAAPCRATEPRAFSLRVSDEFDVLHVGEVELALDRYVDGDTPLVVFDLREVRYPDLAGLGTIFGADERAQNSSFDVMVVRPRGPANRLLTRISAAARLTLVERAPTLV